MRTIILTLTTLFTMSAGAQNLESVIAVGLPLKDGKVVYEIIDSTKATKEQLVTSFQLAARELGTIQVVDKETGLVTGKSNLIFPFTYQ